MFTYNGRDAHRAITPSKINLPYKVAIADILPERRKTEDDEADPALQRLPSPRTEGHLVTRVRTAREAGVENRVGRVAERREARVFVMEEEYRMQKAQTDVRGHGNNGRARGR